MFLNPAKIIRLGRTGAAAAVLATFVAAHSVALHAEILGAAQIVAPSATPTAAPAAAPRATPAVVNGPSAQPAANDSIKPGAAPLAVAPAPSAMSTATCTGPAEFAHLAGPLQRTARQLAGGEPLTIVAIGSSSTAGAGASSAAASYPSRLAVELSQRFPRQAVTVLNRGVNGEETEDMMARFDSGVIAEHPQLVIWQVGTNSVLRDRPLQSHEVELREGIDELKAIGADVVLIDPQYAPKVLAKSETAGMNEQIAIEAKEENVDLFRRFALMRDWYETQHLGFDVFLSPDGLHMNDWGYACVAKFLARGIAEAATRPIASAAAHPAH